MPKQPRIVAELGRPETPEEAAARRAENTRKHRANQTVINLVLALAASLGVVALIVLVVVRPDQPPRPPVDYIVVASEAQSGSPVPLIAPALPEGWSANSASLRADGGDSLVWRIGFLTPQLGFIALNQGIDSPSDWFTERLGDSRADEATDETVIDGITWDVYDRRDSTDPGNYAYSLATEVDGVKYLLHGAADNQQFETLATVIATDLPTVDR